MIVLDTSVILKWYLEEEDSDKALYYRTEYLNQQISITVPDLILYEISNALKYNKDFIVNDVKLVIESIYLSKIKIVSPTIELINQAIEFSSSFDVSIYDSTYLALSSLLNFQFITADEKFYKKIISKNKNLKIKLLKNIIIN
jgi:predicted nucleic acid-binding protein